MSDTGRKRHWYSLALIAVLLCGVAPTISQKDPKVSDRKLVLEERGSPLKAVMQNGSALALRNVSAKEIIRWNEACLSRAKNGYKLLKLFTPDVSPVLPGAVGVDEFGSDATPLLLCRKADGLLAVTDVQFADGSTWKSRWVNPDSDVVEKRR